MKYYLLKLKVKFIFKHEYVKLILLRCNEEDIDTEVNLSKQMVIFETGTSTVETLNLITLTEERYNVLSIYL